MKKIIYNLILLILLSSTLLGEVVDFIVSDGMGPYKLSNTHPKDVRVSISKNIIDPLDYNVNEEKATIFFAKPPERGKVVKIEYNISEVSLPTAPNSFVISPHKDSNNNFDYLDGSYKTKAYGGDFGFKFALKNSDTITKKDLSSSLNYNNKIGKVTLGATYTATGANFKDSKEILELLASYNENNLTIDTKFIDGDDKNTITNKLGYTINPNLKFNMDQTREAGESYSQNSLSYSIENKFKDITAKLYSTIRNIENTSETKSEVYGITMAGTGFQGNASFGNNLKDGVDTKYETIGGKINLKDLTLDATNTRNITDTSKTDTRNINLGIKGQGATLSTSSSLKYTDGYKTEVINKAQGSYDINKYTKVTGLWENSSLNDIRTKLYETGINYKDLYLDLYSKYKTNQTGEDSFYESETGLSYNPNSYFGMTINYLNKKLSEDNRFKHLKLTGNYKIDKFNIYALFVDRDSNITLYEDTKSAKLAYELFKFMEIWGAWTDNPENKELYFNKTEYNYGAKFNFGDINLTGNAYESINDFYERERKYDLGITAKLFGGSLSGSVVFNKNNNDNFTKQYILGYTKAINRLNLSLKGEYKKNHNTNEEDLQGDLSLGISF